MNEIRKLLLESDGTTYGTVVRNEDGKPVNITGLTFRINADGLTSMTIETVNVRARVSTDQVVIQYESIMRQIWRALRRAVRREFAWARRELLK